MLKHCLKNFENERLLLKLEMIENLKESVSMKVKNYSYWPFLWNNSVVIQNNITFQFDNVICYSNVMKLCFLSFGIL